MTDRDAGGTAAPSASLTPHIVVRGADAAGAWYGRVFGAVEVERIPVPGGRLMSLELRIAGSRLMVADEFPELGVLSPESVGGTPVVLHVVTEDVDATWQRAVDSGAEVRQALGDTFWGERYGQFVDPFGHRWGVARRVREVPADEVRAAAARLFAAPD